MAAQDEAQLQTVKKAVPPAARRSVTIRSSLARNLTMMILLTAGGILVVSYVVGSRVVEELSERLIRQHLDHTRLALEKFFLPIESDLRLLRQWGNAGLIGPLELEAVARRGSASPPPAIPAAIELNAFFVPMLTHLAHVDSMMIANTRGEEYLLLRRPDHWVNRITGNDLWGRDTFWMRRNDDGAYDDAYWKALDYEPRERPWFVAALEKPDDDTVHWTAPYRFFTTKDPGITASLRFENPDDPDTTWVIAFDVLMMELSRFTTELDISPRGKALIVTEDRRVAGLPRDERFATPEALHAFMLTSVKELGLPELADGAAAAEAQGLLPGDIFSYQSGGEIWWAGMQPFQLGDSTLRIVVVAPEDDFLAGVIEQRNIMLGITACALLLAFLLALTLARRYSSPLAALAAQAERIQQLDVGEPAVIDTRLFEVGQLADSQEKMRTALDSFSRYVPLEVVRELMHRDEAASIGGARRNITVLFTDIQGFTTIAEGMEPEALTAHMSDYFRAMLGIIQGDGFGEVTQLTGDGFVAFWGAPLDCPNHAAQAADTVLACRARLAELNAEWRERGVPELPTRFGIASGPVVVGNVGSPERLVYTAVGDTINLASRLEGINRFYGTWVMVSEETRRAAGDDFTWRKVDRVRAKGKNEPIDLYELLGRAREVPEARLDLAARYEVALDHYRERRFETATEGLEELVREYPNDLSVTRLLDLCRAFLTTPPPPDWDGATNFLIK